MGIKFGPAVLGPVDEAIERLEDYYELGLRACEVAFTYGAYIKDKEDAEKIGKKAKELGISLSIHAPYWINLNAKDKAKKGASRTRIIESCKIGEWLGAKNVVFHPGFYLGMDREEVYENIREQILRIMEILREKKWKVKIAPETMGKINVFGSVKEISRLVKDTKCGYCIDFAHVLAREKKVDYGKIKKLFPGKEWHCHFSGIVYGDKGERNHIKTPEEGWKDLLREIPKNKDVVIINESPDCVVDSVKGLEIARKI